MSFVGNLLWFVFGGWLFSLLWLLFAGFLACTIVGIPFAVIAMRIARFAAFPFGKELVDAKLIGENPGTGAGIANVLWIVLAGFWLAIGHALYGALACLTIIGIPFGLGHFKLSQASFAPLGKRIVTKELAATARQRHAQVELDRRMSKV